MVIARQRYWLFLHLTILVCCFFVPFCDADQQIAKKDIADISGTVSFSPVVPVPERSLENTRGTLDNATISPLDTRQLRTENRPGYVPGHIIVRYKPAGILADPRGRELSSRLNAEAGAVRATSISLMGVSDVELISLPADADIQAAIAVYSKNPAVLYAGPDYLYRFVTLPDDPSFGLQWGLKNTGQSGGMAGSDISAPDAWNLSTGSDAVIIAVADTGVDYNHPDVRDNVWTNSGETGTDPWGHDKRSNGIDDDSDGYIDDWNGWNFYFHNNDTMDYEGHGTHCAGIIGAVGNNSEGVSGVNWQVRVMPLDISIRNGGYLSTFAAVEGFQYAKDHGAKIISCSWGSYSRDRYLQDVIVNNPDILFVVSAGNDANNNDANPFYPASYPYENIISVAASDPWDNLAWYSNYGMDSVDLAAPGSQIYSTYPASRGNYEYLSGTSMAAPHVAGVAGLIMAAQPTASPVRIKNIILQNAEVKNPFAGKMTTAGRLDAYHSLLYQDVPFLANFTATPVEGKIPLTVRFTDTSAGDPDTWNWSFGTGDVSSLQNPEYTFTRAGIFPVTLITTNRTTGRSSVAYHPVHAWSDKPGVSWVEATGGASFSPRRSLSAEVFHDRVWVLAGDQGGDVTSAYTNDVWSSPDGVNWTRVTGAAAFSGRSCHSSVTYNDRIWVIGGFAQDDQNLYIKNDVWYSDDGINWTRATASAPFSNRWGHRSVVFGNKMWVIGGESYINGQFFPMNDVWYSDDGVNWTPATGSAAFPARLNFGLVVFDNRMWVIGGTDFGGVMNDVWSSPDGVTWTPATGSAAFSPRCQHTSVVFDDRMWMIGGYDWSWYKNDVWYSRDGVNWREAASSAEFPARDTAASVVFDNRMWEIGGFVGGSRYAMYNDIWYSPPYRIPAARFTATPRQGLRPLRVQFNDSSGNDPSHWYWDFGDNSTGNEQNPRHQYTDTGRYTVSLTAANLAGSNTTTKVWYITVTDPAIPPENPPVVSPAGPPDKPDTSGPAVRLTSLAILQNARQGSMVTLAVDQNITPEYPVAISRIRFIPDKDIVELEGIVRDLRFGDIPEACGRRVAGYERVELVGINPRLVRNGSVLFQVAGSWLLKEDADPSDIVLMRYHDHSWEELPTRFDHESAGSYSFIATTPEFSDFAVSVKQGAGNSTPLPGNAPGLLPVSGREPPVSPPDSSVSSPVPTTAVHPRTATTRTTQPAPGLSPVRNPGIPVAVIYGIPLLLAAAGGTCLIRRWWIRRQNPALFRDYD